MAGSEFNRKCDIMGGIVIEILGFKETGRWSGHSSSVAKFLQMEDIDMVSKGDDHDGTIIFDPMLRRITINSDYFKMPYEALKFWRNIGFDVVFSGEDAWEV